MAIEAEGLLQEAITAGSTGNYRQAVRLLQEAIGRGNAPNISLLYLGRAWHRLGDHTKALICYRDYRKLESEEWAGWFFAGRTYLALGMNKRAIKYLKAANKREPDHPEILAMLGMAALRGRRLNLAQKYLEKATVADPENTRIYRAYLNTLLTRGLRLARRGRNDDKELARQMLYFVIDNGLDGPLPRLELGRLFRSEGEYLAALVEYIKAAEFSPQDVTIRWCIASLYSLLGDSDSVSGELNNIRLLGVDIPELSWSSQLVDQQLIRSHMEAGRYREAQALCRTWLKTWVHSDIPKDSIEAKSLQGSIHLMLAECLRMLKEYEMAEKHVRRAIHLTNKESIAIALFFQILWDSENLKELETQLSIYGAQSNLNEELVRFRALFSWKLAADTKITIGLLQDALRLCGPEIELCYALASSYLAVGLVDLAETWFKRGRSLNTADEKSWLGEIKALEVQIEDQEEGALTRLIEVCTAYLELWPENIAIRRDFAMLLVNSQRYELALPELKTLLAWNSENASLRRLVARVYFKCGDYQGAALLFKGLLRENPRNFKDLLEFIHALQHAGATNYAKLVLEKARPIFLKREKVLDELEAKLN